jgi:uncharacterized protein
MIKRSGSLIHLLYCKKFMKLNWLDIIALVLVIIGGLNWALVGLFDFDLVAQLFGAVPVVTKVVYDLVGLAAVYLAIIAPKLGRV